MSFADHVRRIIPVALAALVRSGAMVAAVGGASPANAATDGKLVLVLDSSGSMAQRIGGQAKITVKKHALNTVVDHLPTGAQVVAATTPTISYLNRSVYDSRQYAATPGAQYIVLSKSRVASESQFLVPYRLVVKVIGKAGTGAPDYVALATPTPTPTPPLSASPTAVVSTTPSSPPTAQAGNGVSTGVVIGVALAALALGSAAAFAFRRRRS